MIWTEFACKRERSRLIRSVSHGNGTQSHWCHSVSHHFWDRKYFHPPPSSHPSPLPHPFLPVSLPSIPSLPSMLWATTKTRVLCFIFKQEINNSDLLRCKLNETFPPSLKLEHCACCQNMSRTTTWLRLWSTSKCQKFVVSNFCLS